MYSAAGDRTSPLIRIIVTVYRWFVETVRPTTGKQIQYSASRLGVCPNCGHDIHPIDELITYERSDSPIGVSAEFPACGEVVDPE
jgi:hypothetical protein